MEDAGGFNGGRGRSDGPRRVQRGGGRGQKGGGKRDGYSRRQQADTDKSWRSRTMDEARAHTQAYGRADDGWHLHDDGARDDYGAWAPIGLQQGAGRAEEAVAATNDSSGGGEAVEAAPKYTQAMSKQAGAPPQGKGGYQGLTPKFPSPALPVRVPATSKAQAPVSVGAQQAKAPPEYAGAGFGTDLASLAAPVNPGAQGHSVAEGVDEASAELKTLLGRNCSQPTENGKAGLEVSEGAWRPRVLRQSQDEASMIGDVAGGQGGGRGGGMAWRGGGRGRGAASGTSGPAYKVNQGNTRVPSASSTAVQAKSETSHDSTPSPIADSQNASTCLPHDESLAASQDRPKAGGADREPRPRKTRDEDEVVFGELSSAGSNSCSDDDGDDTRNGGFVVEAPDDTRVTDGAARGSSPSASVARSEPSAPSSPQQPQLSVWAQARPKGAWADLFENDDEEEELPIFARGGSGGGVCLARRPPSDSEEEDEEGEDEDEDQFEEEEEDDDGAKDENEDGANESAEAVENYGEEKAEEDTSEAPRQAPWAAETESGWGGAAASRGGWERSFKQDDALLRQCGLWCKRVEADGACLFRAFSDQLEGDGGASHLKYRASCVEYMEANCHEFAPFVEGDFGAYCARLREPATWGGHIEAEALSRVLSVNTLIHVPAEAGAVDGVLGAAVEITGSSADARCVQLCFHPRYHCGAHYNSVRLLRDGGDGLPALVTLEATRSFVADAVAQLRRGGSKSSARQ